MTDWTTEPIPEQELNAPPTGAGWINPQDQPRAFWFLILAQTIAPGIVSELAGMNPRKWDKRDGTGQSGATIVYNGDGLAAFSCKLQIGWNSRYLPTAREQYAEWDTFKALLKPPTEKNPAGLDIFHPVLAMLPVQIISVVVEDVIGPKWIAPGVAEWEIKFLQNRQAKPAGAKSSGSKANSKDGSGGSLPDPVDTMIEDLTKEMGDLL
jgi:hypothetical protein